MVRRNFVRHVQLTVKTFHGVDCANPCIQASEIGVRIAADPSSKGDSWAFLLPNDSQERLARSIYCFWIERKAFQALAGHMLDGAVPLADDAVTNSGLKKATQVVAARPDPSPVQAMQAFLSIPGNSEG